MRKYTVASCSLGTYFNQSMEDAIRANRMKRLELSGSLVTSTDETAQDTVKRIQGMVKDGVLVIGSVHIPFGSPYDPSAVNEEDRLRNCEAIKNVVRKCVEAGLGAPAYTLHGGMEPTLDHERAHRIAQSRKSIGELAPFFAELGADLNIEILPRSCVGNCVEELRAIVDGQAPNVGICFDVNHVMNRAKELPDMIRTLASRIKSFHLSDYDNVDEQHWTIPHSGMIEWHSVMAAIKEIDHDLNMIFECHALRACDWRPYTAMDAAVRLFEYSAFYLENIEKFAELDKEFERFAIPGNC